MKSFKIVFFFLFLTALFNCGKNEPKREEKKKETTLSETPKTTQDTSTTENSDIDSSLNATIENKNIAINSSQKSDALSKNNLDKKNVQTVNPITIEAEKVIDSPLRNLLNNGQLGKSYTKKELIEKYKFPKEAVDLIKNVTYIGTNKLYFNWGSTWLVEKVSDAEFENDTLIFVFKQNKTYVSGGAIGIKYNKKIYTNLILNNGTAYIPTVKGFHWDIAK